MKCRCCKSSQLTFLAIGMHEGKLEMRVDCLKCKDAWYVLFVEAGQKCVDGMENATWERAESCSSMTPMVTTQWRQRGTTSIRMVIEGEAVGRMQRSLDGGKTWIDVLVLDEDMEVSDDDG